jgi:zinc transporter 1/2/3
VDIDVEDHHHSCIVNIDLKSNINPYIFEFACVFHSVLIGISLGVQEDIKSLLIALIFHQFLEGASIGWIMNDIGKVKKVVMILVYSTSAPIGIIIGNNILPDTSTPSSTWQVCLLGLSGGMLIYISLIQIFIEEMSKQVGEP